MGRTVSAPASFASWTWRVASRMPLFVVPEIGCNATRQPEPADVVFDCWHRRRRNASSARWRRGVLVVGSSVNRVARPLQEQIGRTVRERSRGRGPGRLRDLELTAPTAEAAGEDRRPERFEVRLTRQLGVERLEQSRRFEQQRRSVTPAPPRQRRSGRAAARVARVAVRPAGRSPRAR